MQIRTIKKNSRAWKTAAFKGRSRKKNQPSNQRNSAPNAYNESSVSMLTRYACTFYRQFVFVLTEEQSPSWNSLQLKRPGCGWFRKDAGRTKKKITEFSCTIHSINQSIIQSIKWKKMCLNGFSFCFTIPLASRCVGDDGEKGETRKRTDWDC